MSRVAFLDLNGTLVAPVVVERLQDHYLIDGAPAAIARLCEAGFQCPVVTTQSRIARGFFSEAQFAEWFRAFALDMANQGAFIDGPYVCPHRFGTACRCKKPNTSLFERAAADLNIELTGAFMIGDSAPDMEAAIGFGGLGCLVRTGAASDATLFARALPHAAHVGDTLDDVVSWILSRSAA